MREDAVNQKHIRPRRLDRSWVDVSAPHSWGWEGAAQAARFDVTQYLHAPRLGLRRISKNSGAPTVRNGIARSTAAWLMGQQEGHARLPNHIEADTAEQALE